MANERTLEYIGKPLLTFVHELPLLVDRNTPPSKVPAKIFDPLMANDWT
jgi:hypothetical protein